MSPKEIVQNCALLLGFLALCYCVGRVVARWQTAQIARRLAPLASTVNGRVDSRRGVLVGTYAGRRVQVTISSKETVGSGDSQSHIKPVHITVLDLPGKADWWLQYHVTGLLGQGPKQLRIYTRKPDGLAERLAATGITSEVEAVNAGSDIYIAARFERHMKSLTYTDDITPGPIPAIPVFERQLQMAVRLAEINEQLNA